ncbi:IS110 family transposase [Amycolatopsis australiensis]|uniref:IS110 family transposase n=1 Tax=Amycolatopsis australiensis TaxID=546364 RepID=UPI0011610937|nr:IS110 family transposase [Amycolatopsis australiensis]
MGNSSGISRGDRNRNVRLARLRALVPAQNAIVGIDLADAKQMVVVTDHDSKVLARKTFRCRAWDLGTALDWAARRASEADFSAVTVACEPTGHRWRVLGQLAADPGHAVRLCPTGDDLVVPARRRTSPTTRPTRKARC